MIITLPHRTIPALSVAALAVMGGLGWQSAQATPRPEKYAVVLWVTPTGCQVDAYLRDTTAHAKVTDRLIAGGVLRSPNHPTELLIPGGQGVAYKVIRHPGFPQTLSAVTYTNHPSLAVYQDCPTPGSTPSTTTTTSPAPTTTASTSTTSTTTATTPATSTTSTTSTTTTYTAPAPTTTRPAPLPWTPGTPTRSTTSSTTSTPAPSSPRSASSTMAPHTSSSGTNFAPSQAGSTLPDTGSNALTLGIIAAGLIALGGCVVWLFRRKPMGVDQWGGKR